MPASRKEKEVVCNRCACISDTLGVYECCSCTRQLGSSVLMTLACQPELPDRVQQVPAALFLTFAHHDQQQYVCHACTCLSCMLTVTVTTKHTHTSSQSPLEFAAVLACPEHHACCPAICACRQAAPTAKKGSKSSQQAVAAAAPTQPQKPGSKQPNLKELIKQSKNAKKR